jgi:hypothetical protein
VRSSSKVIVNDVWRTCCALHNLLLKEVFKHLAQSGTQFIFITIVILPQDGQLDWSVEAVDEKDAPLVFSRLKMFGMEADRTYVGPSVEEATVSEKGHAEFREALIAHFNYRWELPPDHAERIVWPSRNGDSYFREVVK